MKRLAAVMWGLCIASIGALAEVPMTIVTPENAGEQAVGFSVTIVAPPDADLARVTLNVWLKSAKYGKIGKPGLYPPNGKWAALNVNQVKAGKPKSYWCTLPKAHLGSSRVSVPCYPEKTVDGVDPDTQSMEYTLNLKDFMGKETASVETGTVSTNSCFGIPCDFSGRLTPEQEKNVPRALRNAFHIDVVSNITETDLRQLLTRKKKLAEETRNGVRHVAIQDFRCVTFPNKASGMMIVIERYRVVNQNPDALKARTALLDAMRKPDNPLEGADPTRFEAIPITKLNDNEYTWGAFHIQTATRTFHADIASAAFMLSIRGEFAVEADGRWKAVNIEKAHLSAPPPSKR